MLLGFVSFLFAFGACGWAVVEYKGRYHGRWEHLGLWGLKSLSHHLIISVILGGIHNFPGPRFSPLRCG